MAGHTPKEQCFRDALDEYEKATGKDLKIKLEEWWEKDVGGVWAHGNRYWRALVNSWAKTRRWLDGSAPEPGSVHGLRRPDITMEAPNGKDIVADIKFTDAKGNVDPWRAGQKEAYEDINQQEQGFSRVAELSKQTCKCNANPQRETVRVPAPAFSPNGQFYMVPIPGPGGVPAMPPVPASPGLPPIFEPVPVFP